MWNTTRPLLLLLSSLLLSAGCGGSHHEQKSHIATRSPASYADESAMRGAAIASQDAPMSVPAHESYAQVQENSYKETQEQAFSTFSIDVDTAAYSNTRRFLHSGHLPPSHSVRVEEYINYFQYDYAGPVAKPNGEMPPFAVHSETTTSPWNAANELVRIGIQGERIATSELPPRNLVFLIDVSGSMGAADKLPLLREGFKMLTQTLGEEDFVSIVVYAGAAGAVLLPTSGADKEAIMGALDRLRSGGGTNGGEGISLAYKLAEQNFRPEAINRVVLASDGDFNVGMTNKDALISLVEKKREHGVYLSVLGFGRGNLKDATMEQIADKGNGNYSYIDSAREARKVLVDEGGATLVTIAKDVKVQVEFNPKAVESYRLIGYENRVLAKEDFDNDRVDAGELGAGHSVTALYEVVPTESRGSEQLATVQLRYKRPDKQESERLSHSIDGTAVTFENASQDMRFATSVAGFGLLLRNSKHAGKLDWETLQVMAETAVADHKSEHRREFLTLVDTARSLSGSRPKLAN